MTQEKLSSLLMLLDRQIVQLIIEKRGAPEKEAVRLLYNSELYAMLEQEDSKLWHFSAPTLYNLLAEELETGKITWPEEG